MKTINLDGTFTENPDARDNVAPRNSWTRGFQVMADGIHGVYTLADGKTTGHAVIPMETIIGLFEKVDSNFVQPPRPAKPLTTNPLNVK